MWWTVSYWFRAFEPKQWHWKRGTGGAGKRFGRFCRIIRNIVDIRMLSAKAPIVGWSFIQPQFNSEPVRQPQNLLEIELYIKTQRGKSWTQFHIDTHFPNCSFQLWFWYTSASCFSAVIQEYYLDQMATIINVLRRFGNATRNQSGRNLNQISI